MRTPENERMVRFSYYANIAKNILKDEAVQALLDSGYDNPADVLQEIVDYCHSQRTDT